MSAGKREIFLQRCLANTDRLQRLLADVSIITRMDDGCASIVKEPADLAEIIANVTDDRQVIAAARGMVIENDVAGPLKMAGNAPLLEAVFNNLTDNAIAYSGGTEIRIELQHADDGKIAITFSDNGCGVPPEHLPHLFERFYRIDKGRSRAAGGTGLGLAIAKNAVLLHGGSITVENRRTGGLLFRITFARG